MKRGMVKRSDQFVFLKDLVDGAGQEPSTVRRGSFVVLESVIDGEPPLLGSAAQILAGVPDTVHLFGRDASGAFVMRKMVGCQGFGQLGVSPNRAPALNEHADEERGSQHDE